MNFVVCSSRLLMFLDTYTANNMDPDQTALIRVHIVRFHETRPNSALHLHPQGTDCILTYLFEKTM